MTGKKQSMENNQVIKILHCPGTLGLGGAETMIMNLFEYLDRTHITFDFVVNGSEKGYYEEGVRECGGCVYHITRRSESFLKNHIELYRLIKTRGYKIIHFHTQNAFLTSMQLIASRLAGAERIIVHCHNTRDWRGKPYVLLHRMFRKYLYRHADVRVACGKEAASWLYGTEENVHILPIPVPCSRFLYSPDRCAALREREGFTGKKIYVHVGRFTDEKNHRFLIDIFRELKRMEDNAVLFLIGDGVLKCRIEEQVLEYGLVESVKFWGNITNVHDKLVMSDVFLFPSEYEGFPTAVLEAQAAGLPCYISDSITPDIRITGLVKQLSLKRGAEEWASEIQRSTVNFTEARENYNSLIRNAYDISVTAEQIMGIYGLEGG